MTTPSRPDQAGSVFYRLPHPMTYPPLASGIYWIAVCHCHYGRVVGLNPHAQRGTR